MGLFDKFLNSMQLGGDDDYYDDEDDYFDDEDDDFEDEKPEEVSSEESLPDMRTTMRMRTITMTSLLPEAEGVSRKRSLLRLQHPVIVRLLRCAVPEDPETIWRSV